MYFYVIAMKLSWYNLHWKSILLLP